jgi:hypothetical protein
LDLVGQLAACRQSADAVLDLPRFKPGSNPHQCLARAFLPQALQDFDRRGLAGALWAQRPENFTG